VLFNLFYEILLIAVPLITTPYVSRVLGPDGVGTYSYTSSLVTYFTLFAGLGTAEYGKREIAGCRDDINERSRLFFEIELLSMITSAISIASWLILCTLYTEYKYLMLLFTFSILRTCFDISWFYAGIEKFKYIVSINAFFKIAAMVSIFVFVKSSNDIDRYVLIESLSLFLGSFSMWIFLPRKIRFVKIQLSHLKKHLKEVIIYFIPSIANVISSILDKTFIGIITDSSTENGYYEQATKIINLAKSVSFVALDGVVYSRNSYLFRANKDTDKIAQNIQNTFCINTFLSIGCIFGVYSIASIFVPLFFGDGYDKTINIIYVLLPLVFIISISHMMNSLYYSPTGRRMKSAVYVVIGAGINLVLNIIFINLWGVYGAAVSSLISETVVTILFVSHCSGYLSLKTIINCLWKKLIAGAVMGVSIYLFNMIHINTLLKLIIDILGGASVYVFVLFLLKDSTHRSVKQLFFSEKHQQ
jgi:O-antigen/teichoic acid export membrane protein